MECHVLLVSIHLLTSEAGFQNSDINNETHESVPKSIT